MLCERGSQLKKTVQFNVNPSDINIDYQNTIKHWLTKIWQASTGILFQPSPLSSSLRLIFKAAHIICYSLHITCVCWLIFCVYILQCIAFSNSACSPLQFLPLRSCQLVLSNHEASLPPLLILSSLTLSENKLYFLDVNYFAMV